MECTRPPAIYYTLSFLAEGQDKHVNSNRHFEYYTDQTCAISIMPLPPALQNLTPSPTLHAVT